MKKSALALFVATLLVAGCDDKEKQALTQEKQTLTQEKTALTEKVQASEQTVSELKANLEAATKELEQLRAEVGKFPALSVKIESLLKKQETLKHPKPKNQDEQDYWREETPVLFSVNVATTPIDWLNQLLLKETFNYFKTEGEPEVALDANLKELLTKRLEQHYQASLSEAREFMPIGLDFDLNTEYLGQWNNLVTFAQSLYTYTGGAHGMFSTQYINVDVDKKAVISLDMLVEKGQQAKLKALLWQAYVNRARELADPPVPESVQPETFVNEADFDISTSFYFTSSGATFVYPPYAIGAFAEGEIELSVPYSELNPLLAKPYQRAVSEVNR